MPRDGSGVYTLPAGNPVVTNTVISSVWANSTLSDIAAQLNNVFTRDGLLGPTGPFKLMDGTVAAPGLAFNSEPGFGWFRQSASLLGFASQGKTVQGLNASTAGVTTMTLRPRVDGVSQLNLQSAAEGSPAGPYLSMGAGATNGTIAMREADGNSSTTKIILYQAGGHQFTGNGSFSGGVSAGTFNLLTNWAVTQNEDYVFTSMAADWVWVYTKANGQIRWQRPNAIMTSFEPNGDFIAGGNIWVGNSGSRFGLVDTGGTRYLRFSVDNWRLEWSTATGRLSYLSQANAELFAVDGSGNGRVEGGWSVKNAVTAGTGVSTSTGNIQATNGALIAQGSGGGVLQLTHTGVQNKYLRCINDNFDILNSAGSNQILTVTNAGRVAAGSGYLCRTGPSGGFGANQFNWFWNVDSKLYGYIDDFNAGWVPFSSDERLKEEIVPLESDEDAFMALRPIRFRFKPLGPRAGLEQALNDGLSAQNVRASFPHSTFGDFDTPAKENGSIEFPGSVDDRAVSAHIILRVQDLINRVRQLENQ